MGLRLEQLEHLLGTTRLESSVLVIGLGSGGFPVFQQLAQSGVSRFVAVDPDDLDEANLLKHPGLRRDIGRPKVDLAAEWLHDRHPAAEIACVRADVFDLERSRLLELVDQSDIVVSATDSNAARHFINDLCIEAATPMTVGAVFRGGVGGSVLIYRPGASGCYACMEALADDLESVLPSDEELPLTADEVRMTYGRGVKGYAAAGLVSDISLVAAVHAQATLGEILAREAGPRSSLAAFEATWVSIRIRVGPHWRWTPKMLDVPPQDSCSSCGGR